MKYVLIYMPEPFNEESLRFFETEEDAWGYVKDNILCKLCIKLLEKGYDEIRMNGEVYRMECKHPSQTSCGAEWEVITAEDYYDCKGDVRKLFEKCWGCPVKKKGNEK